MGRAAIEGWITLDQATKLLRMSGQDFDALKKQAVTREFKPVPLGVTASMTIRNTLRTIDSQNVMAKLDGVDPALKNEYVVYTAHWDHFGKTRRRDLPWRPRQRVRYGGAHRDRAARSRRCRRRRSDRFFSSR